MLRDSSFCNRVWTLQERFLSPRLLYFAAEVEWQCGEHVESDTDDEYEQGVFEMGIASFKRATNTIGRDRKDFDLHKLREHWADMAGTYTQSNVTYSSDRAIALQGVIQYVQERTGYESLAGLWRPILLSQLLWWSHDTLAIKHKPTFAPSWSWLGRSGSIWYSFFEPQTESVFDSEIVHAQARFLSGEAGPRWIGEIHIEGFLIPIAFDGTRHCQLSAFAIDGLKIGKTPHLVLAYDIPFHEMELFLLPIANGSTDSETRCYFGLVLSLSRTTTGAYERQGYHNFNSRREECKEITAGISKVPSSELEQQIMILV